MRKWKDVGKCKTDCYKKNTVKKVECRRKNVDNLVEIVNTRSIFACFQHLFSEKSKKPCKHEVGFQLYIQQMLNKQRIYRNHLVTDL